MRHILDMLLQNKGKLEGLTRGMHVVLMLNAPVFILPFSGNDAFIIKYGNITRFQQNLMSE